MCGEKVCVRVGGLGREREGVSRVGGSVLVHEVLGGVPENYGAGRYAGRGEGGMRQMSGEKDQYANDIRQEGVPGIL